MAAWVCALPFQVRAPNCQSCSVLLSPYLFLRNLQLLDAKGNSFHSKDGESTSPFPLFLVRRVQRFSGRAGNPAKVSWSQGVGSLWDAWHHSSGGCAHSEVTWQIEPLRGPHTK